MTQSQTTAGPGQEKSAPRQLEDGTVPATPRALLDHLAALGIDAATTTHAPVFTVEQAKAVRGKMNGAHSKNLFLRNKKGRMWLITCLEDRQLDLKALGAHLGAGGLSFASADRLMRFLGVIPGAVTPFAVLNDTGAKVSVVLDTLMLEREPLNFHPLDNAMTTSISTEGLLRFLANVGHEPTIVRLDDFLRA